MNPRTPIDILIECLLYALLAFMPFAFGVVHAWSEMVVITVVVVMALLLAIRLVVRRDERLVWTWAYVPIVLFLLLTAVQLVPLPAALVELVSPNSVVLRRTLVGDLPNAEQRLSMVTLSFYPHATQHDLRILLAVSAVFLVVLNVFRRAAQIKRLLAVIVVIGACAAILALAQNLSGAEGLYWSPELGRPSPTAGPFVNYNNYSQFMNLTIGAALGLLLVLLREGFHGRSVTLAGVVDGLTHPRNRWPWLLGGVVVLGGTTIALSMSRAGTMSFLLAVAFTTLILALRRRLGSWGWLVTALALGAFVSVLWVGFDAVYDRLATLRAFENQYYSRWHIVKDVGRMCLQFPLLGTGMGTHELVYPMFEQSTIRAAAGHVENEYVQAIEEAGLLGLALVLIFAAFIWVAYAALVRRTRLSILSAAYGLGFGLAAVMFHSFTDFGQHLPANACLTATACALMLSLARMGRRPPAGASTAGASLDDVAFAPTPSVASSLRCFLLPSLVLIAGTWSLWGAHRAWSAESRFERALAIERHLEANGWQGTNGEYAALIGEAQVASELDPGNVKYRHWLNVYRWRSISRARDEQTGDVLLSEQAPEYTRRIIAELQEAIWLCPTFGPSHSLVGQLELFVLGEPAGADRIRLGRRLAPNDVTTCLLAGTLDAVEGDIDGSLAHFRHALDLNGGAFSEIAAVYVEAVDRPELALELAGDDARRLSQVAGLLSDRPDHADVAERARARAASLLQSSIETGDASPATLARMAMSSARAGDRAAALDYYERALARDYGEVNWRLHYARLLAEDGQPDRAIAEARRCLRLRPQMAAARQLIERLSAAPTGGD